MANVTTDRPTPSGHDTSQSTTYPTGGATGMASWDPGATGDDFLIVFVINSKASAADAPTSLTQNGVALRQDLTGPFSNQAAPTRRITAFSGLIAGLSAGSLLATFPGTQTGCSFIVLTVKGCKTTGTNGADAIRQVLADFSDTTVQSDTFAGLAAFGDATNSILVGLGIDGAITAFTPKSGFSQATEQAYFTPSVTSEAEFRDSADAAPSFAWSSGAKWGGIAYEIVNATPPGSATRVLRGVIVGGMTSVAATLMCVVDSAGTVTFKIGTAPDLAGATTFLATVNVESNGNTPDYTAQHQFTGLTPRTEYYVQAVGDVTSSPIGFFRTNAAAPSSYRIGYLTDFQSLLPATIDATGLQPDGTAFISLDTDAPDLVLLGGDFDHSDPGTGTGANQALAYTQTQAMWKRLYDGAAWVQGVVYSMPAFVAHILDGYAVAHTISDHDYKDNNASKGYNWRDTAFKQTFARYMPNAGLLAVPGCVAQFPAPVGTLFQLFILDTRSQRDQNADTDDASKSMLDGNAVGATGQLQTFLDTLVAAEAAGVVWKLVLQDTPWNPTAQKGGPAGVNPFDNWYGFKTEQQAIIDSITVNHIRNVVFLSGDVHAGYMNPGAPGVFAEIIGPPPNFIPGGGEGFDNFDVRGTWQYGPWANNGYVLMDLTPTQLVARIKDVDGVTRLTMTLAAEGAPPPPPTGGAVSSRDVVLSGGKQVLERDMVLSPAAVAANTTAEQLFPVLGARVGDVVTANKPTAQAGLGIVGVRVSALDQIGITFSNNTAAPLTPTAAETYLIRLDRG